MAVSVTLTPAQVTATSGTTVTITGVAPTGTGRVLIANYGHGGATGVINVSSLTKGATGFNGTPLWEANDGLYNSGGCRYLLDPSTASESVTLTLSDTTDGAVLGVTAFDGVDTGGTPFGTASSSNGASTDPTAISISTETGDYVFYGTGSGLNTQFLHEGTGTEQDNDIAGFAQAALAYGTDSSSISVEWGSGLGSTTWYVMGGVNLNAGGGGGGATPKFLTLLGVG